MQNEKLRTHIERTLRNVEDRRVLATKKLNADTQKNDGQFFTPLDVAGLVASKIRFNSKSPLRILDPNPLQIKYHD